jgi:hypothetical protein
MSSDRKIGLVTLCIGSWVMLTACAACQSVVAAPAAAPSASASPIAAPLKWKASGILVGPVSDDEHQIVSVKDPSVVFHNDMWHIYATTANARGNWSMAYLTFKDWSESAQAKPYYID